MSRAHTIHGLMWNMSSVIFSRVGSLAAQVIAGWYLIPSEFGLFAAVFSVSAILIAIRNGGLFSYLLHLDKKQREEYLLLASYLNYGLFLICCLIGLFQSESDRFYLFVIFSVCLLLSRCVIELRLNYAIQQDFKAIGKLDVYNSIIQHGGLITCIYLGFGVYSLAIPYLLVSILELILCSTNNEIKLKWYGKVDLETVKHMLKKAKWPLLTAFVLGLSQQGDFVALSISTSAYILGIYFFGFQLTAAAGQLIMIVTRTVLTPALVKVKNDSEQYWSDFNFYFSLILIISVIGCTSGLILSKPIISFIWGEKWLDVIAVVNLLLIALISRVVLAVIYAMLDSLQQFKSKFTIILTDSLLIIFTAFISGYSNDIMTITRSITAVQILSLVACLFYIKFIMKFNLSIKKILETISGITFVITVWFYTTYIETPIIYDNDNGLQFLDLMSILFIMSGVIIFSVTIAVANLSSSFKQQLLNKMK